MASFCSKECVKPILNTTLPCLHEASWRHWEHLLLGQTNFANTSKLHTPRTANGRPWLVYDASDWLVWLPCNTDIKWLNTPNWPWHLAACHVKFPLPLQSFDVTHEWKIYLSACGRYKINCEIPPIQNTQSDLAEAARCILSVSCSTDLDYCVVYVNQVSVFLERVHRTSEGFTPNAKPCCLLFCLPFRSWSKHQNCCNIHLKSELITGQLQSQWSWQNFQAVLGQ